MFYTNSHSEQPSSRLGAPPAHPLAAATASIPLADAEAAMLQLSFDRAELNNLKDGQRILELGCGWGSFTVFMAERLPKNQILAVSNSHSQKDHIEKRLRDKKITNCKILVKDMNDLELDETFDRIVSIRNV